MSWFVFVVSCFFLFFFSNPAVRLVIRVTGLKYHEYRSLAKLSSQFKGKSLIWLRTARAVA